jgi:hypothetical protein
MIGITGVDACYALAKPKSGLNRRRFPEATNSGFVLDTMRHLRLERSVKATNGHPVRRPQHHTSRRRLKHRLRLHHRGGRQRPQDWRSGAPLGGGGPDVGSCAQVWRGLRTRTGLEVQWRHKISFRIIPGESAPGGYETGHNRDKESPSSALPTESMGE